MKNLTTNQLHVCFYVAYPYYFPHFLPISRYFESQRVKTTYVLCDLENTENMKYIANSNNLSYLVGEKYLFDNKYDALFFANPYEKINDITGVKILLEHGIGTKSNSFYDAISDVDIYLVEGNHKYNLLQNLYPQHKNKLALVGFSKFDPLGNLSCINKQELYKRYNIATDKQTILYAPTFFPSSIEKMADDFPADFSKCNILIKPHYLTYERKKYRKQRKKLDLWSQYPNCTIVPIKEYDIVPLLAIADIMISDESSAMFEFAALNKPVISNRFYKLRLSYYLIPSKLTKRIDSSKEKYRDMFYNAHKYSQMVDYANEALENGMKHSKQRLDYKEDICGEIDGNVSQRIYEVLTRKLNV